MYKLEDYLHSLNQEEEQEELFTCPNCSRECRAEIIQVRCAECIAEEAEEAKREKLISDDKKRGWAELFKGMAACY